MIIELLTVKKQLILKTIKELIENPEDLLLES